MDCVCMPSCAGLNSIEEGLDPFATVDIPPIPFASTDVGMVRNGTAELPGCENEIFVRTQKRLRKRRKFFIDQFTFVSRQTNKIPDGLQ